MQHILLKIEKILDFLLLPADTRELARLNEIHDKFNKDGVDPLPEILQHKWFYHTDKVIFLIEISRIILKQK